MQKMIHDALRLVRVYHDFSQTELADYLGVSKSYLSEIESGKKNVTIELLEKYSNVLKIPVSSLMFFAERIDGSGLPDKSRKFIAGKALKMLDWLATISQTRKSTHGN